MIFLTRTCTGTTACSTDFVNCQLRRFDSKYFRNFFCETCSWKKLEIGKFLFKFERAKRSWTELTEIGIFKWQVYLPAGIFMKFQ